MSEPNVICDYYENHYDSTDKLELPKNIDISRDTGSGGG